MIRVDEHRKDRTRKVYTQHMNCISSKNRVAERAASRKSACHLNPGADVKPSGLYAQFPGVDFLFSLHCVCSPLPPFPPLAGILEILLKDTKGSEKPWWLAGKSDMLGFLCSIKQLCGGLSRQSDLHILDKSRINLKLPKGHPNLGQLRW